MAAVTDAAAVFFIISWAIFGKSLNPAARSATPLSTASKVAV